MWRLASVKPKFLRSYPLPFSLREATDIELDKLVAYGTLTSGKLGIGHFNSGCVQAVLTS